MAKKEETYQKRRLASSYVTSVVSITLVLFMLGMLEILMFNAHKVSNYVRENVGFSIFIKENVNETEIVRLQKVIDIADFVKSTEYITQEEAAEILEKDLGENFLDFLGRNPLLPSIDVRINAAYSNVDSLRIIEQRLKKYDMIQEVYYQETLVEQINKNLGKISLIFLLFAGLLLVIAIALINNTIRLSVYSRRFLIRTMQLVGATNTFIRRPFLTRSVFHGVISALLAILMLLGFVYFAAQQIPEIVDVQDVQMAVILMLSIIVLGVTISWFSTLFAIQKFLGMDQDQLYR
jgi:cell division transport system permease protein